MNTINKIVILSVIVLFMGCSKTIYKNQYTLSKEDLFLSSISETIDKLKRLDRWEKRNEKEILDFLYSDDINDTTNNYLFVFPFKLVKSDIRADMSGILAMSIDLCKNGVIQEKELPYSSRVELVVKDKNSYNIYLPFKRLQQKGLISTVPEKQEDVCLYLKTTETPSWDHKVEQESNVLTFTADEINTIRAEYERLTQ